MTKFRNSKQHRTKRTLTFVILFLFLVIPAIAFAAVRDYFGAPAARRAVDTLATATIDVTNDVAAAKIFSRQEDYAQDLYANIYEKLKHEGSDVAVHRVLENSPFSKMELQLLVTGANITDLIKKENPKQQLSPEEVQKRQVAIQNQLADEKEIADLVVEMQLEVTPTEIFANGDESDSGFDLITDLDRIDAILFGQEQTGYSGREGGADFGGGNSASGFDFSSALAESSPGSEDTAASAPAYGRGGSGSGPTDGSSGSSPGSGDGGPGAGGPDDGGLGAGGPGNGGPRNPPPSTLPIGNDDAVACPLNQAFHDAVHRARELDNNGNQNSNENENTSDQNSNSNADQNPNANPPNTTQPPNTDRSGSGIGSNTGANPNAAGSSSGSGSGSSEEGGPITPAPAADWSRELPCNKIFCLKVELIRKSESPRPNNENCIACHFEKLNDAFKKTLEHNLVPSKATGNLLEAPKCKRAFFQDLKANIIFIPQPIVTPPNDDLVAGADFLKNFQKLTSKYYDTAAPNPATPLINTASSETPPENILNSMNNESNRRAEEISKIMEQIRLAKTAQAQAKTFSALMQEIDTMNAYFEGFVKLYRDTVSDDPSAPCKALVNKPQCKSL